MTVEKWDKLPDDHPWSNGQIIFGMSLNPNSNKNSTEISPETEDDPEGIRMELLRRLSARQMWERARIKAPTKDSTQ